MLHVWHVYTYTFLGVSGAMSPLNSGGILERCYWISAKCVS